MKLVRFGVLEKMDLSVRGASLQELTKENNEKTVLIEQNKLMECKRKVRPPSQIPFLRKWKTELHGEMGSVIYNQRRRLRVLYRYK